MHADSEPLTGCGVTVTGFGCHRKSAVHSSRRTSVGCYMAVAAAKTVRILINDQGCAETSLVIKVARGLACVREGDASQLLSRQRCLRGIGC